MFKDTRRLLVAIRAVSNEIENAQSLPEKLQDEELALYQSDLFDALGELADWYAKRSEADPELPSFERLLEGIKSHPWPTKA